MTAHQNPTWFEIRRPRFDARARLFCFPHGGGGPQAYRSWSDGLPDWIEACAVALPGRGARHAEPAIDDMDRLVEALTDALAPQLDRPFAFFGHSVGAMVAFATARQLAARGWPAPMRLFLSGHAAPCAARRAAPMHDADDDALIAAIAGLGLLPLEAASRAELRRFILPPLRADFRAAERWAPPEDLVLDCPFSVLGGAEDPTVAEADLAGWARHTSAGQSTTLFDGGHFFTQTAETAVLATVADALREDLAALPPSVALGPAADFPLDRCLHTLFREAAGQAGDAPALVGVDQQLSFAELDRRSDLLARRFAAMGCGPDRLVAIAMATSVDFVVALIAALKAGGAYLPIDPATPDLQLAEILREARPVAVAADATMRPRLPADWLDATVSLTEGWAEALAREPLPTPMPAAPEPGPQNLAYCVMTSGTTGKPKGIVCPHEGAVNSYWGRNLLAPYEGEEREACNVFFVWEVLRPLLWGRTAYVIPDDVIYDPRRLIDFLARHRITRALFTPSLLEQILNAAGADLADRLAALKAIVLNGEVVSVTLVRRVAERLPHVRLINDYSISECHDVATGELDARTFPPGRSFAPTGKAMANVRVYVLDDAFRPVPWGAPGEIYVAGPTLARGYLNQPEMTAERFPADPLQPGSRMFRTGDVGRLLPDGQLEIHGRAKFMVKIRGYTIVPEAVEAAITAHVAIGAAAVVVVDDPETGRPSHLAAYLAGAGGRPDDAVLRDLRAHLKARLPHYAIPAVLIPLDALPINKATGKLDLKQLPAPAQRAGAVAPDTAESRPPSSHAGAAGARIKAAWTAVLGAAPMSPEDNFFDLGGHSLKAVELVLAIEEALPVRLDVVDVFAQPTLAALCDLVAERLLVGLSDVAPAPDRLPAAEAKAAQTDVPAAADVAVIGLACRFPGADGPEALWRNLEAGVESITRFSEAELRRRGVPEAQIADRSYVRAGAVLEDVAGFEPRFWGLSEREAVMMDPQQRLFLECCWHALEDAGCAAGEPAGQRMGVFAGCYLPSYLIRHLGALRNLDGADPTRFHLAELGNDKDYLASRVAYHLGLTGPALNVQTSCSTGLVAIAEAVAAIRARRCATALAGASSITFPQAGYTHVKGHVSAPDGRCRSFDAEAGGTVLGDGVGVVVLKRLDAALAEGDRVLAVVKGVAVNNDGALRAGFSAPGVRGQAEVIAEALRDARVSADSISYVEAHGTGTLVGDPIEVRALTQAFRADTDRVGYCKLGSIKPNIGHSNIAAGAAGFIKTVLALHHRRIPPQINLATPNPDLELETSPFAIATEAVDWEAAEDAPRRAGVSSFGIGGTNAHVILEEAPAAALAAEASAKAPDPASGPQILVLSAKTPASLERMRDRMADFLETAPDFCLADVAATLQSGRRAFAHRLAAVVEDPSGAAPALRRQPISAEPATPGARAVFLFPGQGSQHVRMGAGLYRACAPFAQVFDRCVSLFEPHIGRDLRGLFDERSECLLADASGLQPAMFAVEYALARTLMHWGVQPAAAAGHSLGEYVAAALADALDLEDAIQLVAVRAAAMEACLEGAMTSLTTDRATASRLIAGIGGLGIAAVNSPGDIVVSGPPPAIAALEAEAARSGLAARRLAVSRAFHSEMMASAAEIVAEAAARISWREPQFPIASNVTGGLVGVSELREGAYWRRHMLGTVRFDKNLETVCALGPEALIEVGPGRALGRLASTRSGAGGEAPSHVVSTMRHPRDARSSDEAVLAGAIGQIWRAGVEVDWDAVRGPAATRRVSLPGYAFDRRRCWPEETPSETAEDLPANAPSSAPAKPQFYLPSWRRALAPSEPAAGEDSAPDRWLLLLPEADGDAGRLAEQVGNGLAARGGAVERRFRGAESAEAWARDAVASFQSAAGRGDAGRLRVACFLTPAARGRGSDPAMDAARDAAALAALLHALARAATAQPLDFWAIGAGAVSVLDETVSPAAAALLGPLLVTSQEAPQLTVRYVDVEGRVASGESGEAAIARCAEQILSECLAEAPRAEPVLALRGGRRLVEDFAPIALDARGQERGRERGRRLLAQGPHLVTGGLGRIGLALARRLTGLDAEVVLTTRGEAPPPEAWPQLARTAADPRRRRQFATLAEIAAGPGRVSLVTADVADRAAMREVLRDLHGRFGAIGGVFHAAGLADLRYLAEADAALFAAEFESKLRGAEAIAGAIDALRDETGDAPDFVVAFSSLAAQLGGLGMSAYAAANRSMDAYVAERAKESDQKGDVRWLTINWDDWDFEYGKEQVGAYARTRAGLALAPEGCLDALEAALGAADLAQATIATADLPHRAARWLSRRRNDSGAEIAAPPADAAHFREQEIGHAPQRDRSASAGGLQQAVIEVYRAVLGGEAIGPEEDFFALGGDSLLAVQIALQLSRALPDQPEISIGDVFDHPTAAQLAARLEALQETGCAA